jgi:quercetin dioxygenase-like cupin family protein
MIVRDVVSRARFLPDKMGKSGLGAGRRLFCGLNAFEPGQRHEAHVHDEQDKAYLVLTGRAELTLGDEVTPLAAGDFALAPAGVVHAVHNPGPERLVLLVALAPPPGPR